MRRLITCLIIVTAIAGFSEAYAWENIRFQNNESTEGMIKQTVVGTFDIWRNSAGDWYNNLC